MGRHINPVIFKNLKAFLGVFFKEVNFWPLILDISWVSGGMIALFWRKMLFFGSFVLFSVGKHFWCIWDAFRKSLENFGCILDAFRKFRSRDMNAAMWFVPSSLPFHSLIDDYSASWPNLRELILKSTLRHQKTRKKLKLIPILTLRK